MSLGSYFRNTFRKYKANNLIRSASCCWPVEFKKGAGSPFSILRQDLIQDVRQNTAGVVVVDFGGGIEADFGSSGGWRTFSTTLA